MDKHPTCIDEIYYCKHVYYYILRSFIPCTFWSPETHTHMSHQCPALFDLDLLSGVVCMETSTRGTGLGPPKIRPLQNDHIKKHVLNRKIIRF